ncbi:MAG: hypothetical protein JSR65_00605 [Proteobacteria bacterium]|nr:hypothetical protein [Pseudomonadota bacterium]
MFRPNRIHLATWLGVVAFAFAPMPYADAGAPTTLVLDQGWSRTQREFYYHTSQGTVIMPAAFLEALEADNGGRFMDASNLTRFGWLFDVDDNSAKNPYGWPIGFAVDTDATPDLPQAGLTCAACHNGQIVFHGTRVRIDGGQSGIDLNAFATALNTAIRNTFDDNERRTRFIERAVLLGYPKARVEQDFQSLHDGFATADRRAQTEVKDGMTLAGPGRLDAVNDIANAVFVIGLDTPSNIKPGDSPQNFPYLWDIWRFDWVQSNASARQPMARNLVEAMGTGHIHLVDPRSGKLLPEATRWKTTLNVRNIHAIEQQLRTLKAPPWPEEVLGKIDRARAQKGRALFVDNCAGCHGIQRIAGTHEPTEWHVPLVKLSKIGTDPNLAVNFASRRYDASKLGAGDKLGIPEGLYLVVSNVKRQAYLDAGIGENERADFDGFGRKNDINPAPCGYKARPLIGVWATAPFLHNGSVPTVYDLLSETRPTTFRFGDNAFDPVKLGLGATTPSDATVFDPSQPGNGNAGHWFTNESSRSGRIGRALNDDERQALIEYLKAATPADYPTRNVGTPAPAACSDDRHWADHWPNPQTQ